MDRVLFIFVIIFTLAAKEGICESQKEPFKLYELIKCMVCEGESIKDSGSEFAKTLREVVDKLVAKGHSEDYIIQHLKERYGEEIILKPKMQKKTALLWIFPLFIAIFGTFAIIKRSQKT